MNKTSMIILGVVIFIVLGIGLALYWWFGYSDRQAAKKRFKDQIGVYALDVKKTRLGGYTKDVVLYGGLYIKFNADSTFSMNMDVPFIYDSVGTWKVGGAGLEDWNWLYYGRNPVIQTQFDQCCLADSTFYLNSTTPKEGQESIQKLYFKKIE